MVDTKTEAIPLASTVSKELVILVSQYGCGLNRFTGRDNGFSERHLAFDNVIGPTGPSPQTAILNAAASGKFSSDRTIAEYAATTWKVEPWPVP
jgi:hypothetical protein